MDIDQIQYIKKLHDSQTLLDILLSLEDWFDSLDLYSFKNWFDGQVVEGPTVKRYWVSITLMYDYKKMPDPAGGTRIIKNGGKVIYQRARKEKTDQADVEKTMRNASTDERDLPTKPVWLVTITIPRRFIDDVLDQDIAGFEDALDKEKSADEHAEKADNVAPEEGGEGEEMAGMEEAP